MIRVVYPNSHSEYFKDWRKLLSDPMWSSDLEQFDGVLKVRPIVHTLIDGVREVHADVSFAQRPAPTAALVDGVRIITERCHCAERPDCPVHFPPSS